MTRNDAEVKATLANLIAMANKEQLIMKTTINDVLVHIYPGDDLEPTFSRWKEQTYDQS